MSDYLRCSKSLLKLPPLLLYEISTDIQVSEKWKMFAFAVGFSTENVIMIEMSNTDRFPAENVMYHWFSRNPKVDELAKVLIDLDLEKPFYRLKNYMSPETFQRYEEVLQRNRYAHTTTENNLEMYTESNENRLQDDTSNYQTQISNASSASSTSVPVTPEPGLVSISRCLASKVLNNELLLNNSSERTVVELSNFEELLNSKSTKYTSDEFSDEFFERSIQGKFRGEFFITLRKNNFLVESFCLKKVFESMKNQKKLYNIVWALTNFRLNSMPLLTGYCFYENYLFLIYPDLQTKSLFDILHRHEKINILMSLKDRLFILQSIGKVLSFLHCSIPFGGYHGNVISENVLVNSNIILLSGFDKFYTEDPHYLKGFNQILKNKSEKSKPKIEDLYKLDIKNYLELICETLWNIPNKKSVNGDSLIDVINESISIANVSYQGWNEDAEMTVQNIIRKFSTEKSPKIEEIIDELVIVDRSNEPPSYNEIEQIDSTTSFK